MPSLLDPNLSFLLEKDQKALEQTKCPIVTVSATFKEDLKEYYGLPFSDALPEVVLSRAHYSMALALVIQAWQEKIRPEKAWVVDPTNYVTGKNWQQIILTETVGKTLARHPFLKLMKDLVDRFGRQQLPILKSITPTLLFLTQRVTRPIVSVHIAAGNILAEQGKTVIQLVTDPHVRDDYLANADRPNMFFCVFDSRTRFEFLEKAALRGLKVDPDRIIVTGPPIDPRIIATRFRKNAWRSGKLKLCLTTGGLGTNKDEIETILEQLLPLLRKQRSPIQLVVYAGTQLDIKEMVEKLARKHRVRVGKTTRSSEALRLLYHPQLIDSNELLLKYGFPWADGFITKPSGDMAYDAAAAGCFLLTLSEWGAWEHNVRQVFEQRNIARQAEPEHIVQQLQALTNAQGKAQSWVEQAMCNALTIDKSFLQGTRNIIQLVTLLTELREHQRG